MEIYSILFSFLIYFVNAQASIPQVASNGEKTKSFPAVNALITSLEDELWGPDDQACLRATLELLRGVKNNTLWATWVWDSMHPPVGTFYGVRYHLGNYDQCLEAPWSSKWDQGAHPELQIQYCIVDVIRKNNAVEEVREIDPFQTTTEFYSTPIKHRYYSEHFFGVCLPAVCRPSSIAKIYRHMHHLTHLPDADVYVDPRDCEKAGEPMGYSRGFFIFWTVVGLLLATATFSTFYCKDDRTHTLLGTITKYFCLKRNLRSLFKVNTHEITVMNGMRFLTAATVVGIHECFFSLLFPVVNWMYVDKAINSTMGLTVMHLEIVVDTFFAMSGLLLIRGLILGKQKNIFYSIVKRYIRLVGPFALCTLYFSTTAVMSMSRGPLWRRIARAETDVCSESWWRNLLMMNTDVNKLCYVVTWYVSCDFQLAILATLLFWLFRRNRKLGVTAFAAVAVGLTLSLGWRVYSMKLDILPFSLKTLVTLRNTIDLNYTYLTSHSRAGAYLVGMVMGYIVTAYKPRDYRNVISKKWSIVIAVASLATMSTMLSIGAIFAGRPYDPLEAAAVVTTNRVAWAVAVCCLIGVCEYGSVSLIKNLLSWPGFAPLSKLTYGLYLLHPVILCQQKYSARAPATFGLYSVVINAVGVLVVGCAASLILYLILEAPLINISNALFTEKPTPLQLNDIKEQIINNGNSGDPQQSGHNGNEKVKIS